MDSIFEEEKYSRPDLREGYELLIGYYRENRDLQARLFYVERLLEVDRLLGKNYEYLLKKIVKEYDTKELVEEKKILKIHWCSGRFLQLA